MTSFKRTLASIGVIALVIGLSMGAGYALCRTHAALASQESAQKAQILRDSLRTARADVRVDSVRLERVVVQWRTARARFDTVTLRDTVMMIDTLRLLVEQADATVTMCVADFLECNTALALAERAAQADSVTTRAALVHATLSMRRAEKAEARSWRHRLEGAAACGAAGLTIHRLTRD